MVKQEKGYLNIVCYDDNNKPLLLIDGLSGIEYTDGNYFQIVVNKMLSKTPFWNGTGDGIFNETTIEEKEIDFSQISDEEWLKLKKIKSIVLETYK